MKNLSTRELIKELHNRGIECFDPKEWALDQTVWPIDEAIEIQEHLRELYKEEFELPREKLMEILNQVLSSERIREFILSILTHEIKKHLIE
jgi:hypothetical protein